MMKYRFEIYSPMEEAAGFYGFTDTVEISVDSGDPGGEPGEFEKYLSSVLSEWYDGAKVTLVQTVLT